MSSRRRLTTTPSLTPSARIHRMRTAYVCFETCSTLTRGSSPYFRGRPRFDFTGKATTLSASSETRRPGAIAPGVSVFSLSIVGLIEDADGATGEGSSLALVGSPLCAVGAVSPGQNRCRGGLSAAVPSSAHGMAPDAARRLETAAGQR